MTAEGVPFERLDAAGDHAPLARRGASTTTTSALFQADARLGRPERATWPTGGSPAAQGAELREHARRRDPRRRRRADVVVAAASAITAGTVVIAADAWTNDLSTPLGRACR